MARAFSRSVLALALATTSWACCRMVTSSGTRRSGASQRAMLGSAFSFLAGLAALGRMALRLRCSRRVIWAVSLSTSGAVGAAASRRCSIWLPKAPFSILYGTGESIFRSRTSCEASACGTGSHTSRVLVPAGGAGTVAVVVSTNVRLRAAMGRGAGALKLASTAQAPSSPAHTAERFNKKLFTTTRQQVAAGGRRQSWFGASESSKSTATAARRARRRDAARAPASQGQPDPSSTQRYDPAARSYFRRLFSAI